MRYDDRKCLRWSTLCCDVIISSIRGPRDIGTRSESRLFSAVPTFRSQSKCKFPKKNILILITSGNIEKLLDLTHLLKLLSDLVGFFVTLKPHHVLGVEAPRLLLECFRRQILSLRSLQTRHVTTLD